MDGMPSETVQYIKDALAEQGILTPNVLAYALATAKAEAGGKPVREIQGPQQAARLGYGGGTDYYGRGYIQLTHDYNYRDIGRKIGLGDQLVNNPDMALDPKIAAKVMAVFFKERGIAAKAEAGDFTGARRGVNPDNRGQEIAGIAKNYLGKVNSIMGLPSNANVKDYDWSTQMKTYDGRDMVLNNKTGQYEELKNIGKKTTTPTPTLSLANTGKSGATQAIRNPNTGKLEIIKKPNEGGVLNFFKNLISSAGENMIPNAYADSGLYKFQPRQAQTFQPNMYTVQPGDTLSGIAGKYLGNPHMYPQITGYASGNPNMIRPGERLNLGTTSGGPGAAYPNMANGSFNPHVYPVQQQATNQQSQPQQSSAPSAQLSWKPQQADKIVGYLATHPTQINNAPIPKPTNAAPPPRSTPSVLPSGSLTSPWGTGNAIRNL